MINASLPRPPAPVNLNRPLTIKVGGLGIAANRRGATRTPAADPEGFQ